MMKPTLWVTNHSPSIQRCLRLERGKGGFQEFKVFKTQSRSDGDTAGSAWTEGCGVSVRCCEDPPTPSKMKDFLSQLLKYFWKAALCDGSLSPQLKRESYLSSLPWEASIQLPTQGAQAQPSS